MAKITDFEGKLPKRIDDYVIYKLYDDIIIRGKSGFTTKALKNDAKYFKSRNNAKEFGKVSSLCKAVRMMLKELLPKKNNLAVVNSFTKKMREVMTYDLVSVYGERNLVHALKNDAGRQLLKDYEFNPDSFFTASQLVFSQRGKNKINLTVRSIVFPDGANCIGFRVAVLEFDFETKASQLITGNWLFYGKVFDVENITILIPDIEVHCGILFTLLEVQFYNEADGSYEPIVDDRSKSLRIISIC